MTADRARVSFDPTRLYRSVVAQQGRVTLEADTNEAASIAGEALRLETIDFVLCNDRGLGGFAARRHETLYSRNRRQRRGIRGRSKCCGCGGSGKSNSEFQKMTAFHDISLSWCMTRDAGRF